MRRIRTIVLLFLTLFTVISSTLFGQAGLELMEKHALKNDGPYVLYKDNLIHIKYIDRKNGWLTVVEDSMDAEQKDKLQLTIRTGINDEAFYVKLKEKLKTEKPNTGNVSKMLAISDIEGNFDAFRKLLQSNGVINKDFGWTFGDGHLVLIGDFVDRGDMVTEVLWLIYALEEKAKAAGGYVHFVLGNHEIMNMSGDLRYLHPKYVESAQLLKEDYQSLYGEQSELGRWLRTKNVVEKIGDFLFVHGGISPLISGMQLNLREINQVARPYYGDSTYVYPDPRVDTLYSDWGPFWYRGYYNGLATVEEELKMANEKFGVDHIVTGHSLIADTVSVLYGGKLFNLDTPHSKGFNEALLVEGKRAYRVNAKGEKIPLDWKK